MADAVDGNDIKPNKRVSNGYAKKKWKIDGEAKIYVYKGVRGCETRLCRLCLLSTKSLLLV